jgi:hypothetical protein
MDETKLKDLLNKIGKRVFVQYFHEFGDSDISPQVVTTLLQNEESFEPQASATRTANARRIFRDGLEERALSIIAESNRVERKVADEARSLLTQLRKRPV